MITQCKAADAVWRAEAAWNAAYDAACRAERLEQQVADLHRLVEEMHAALVQAPDAKPAAVTVSRRGP